MLNRFVSPIAASLVVGLLAAGSIAASAQDKPPHRKPAEISVSGEGEVHAAPDMAIATLTVMREAPTAREALTASNEGMAKLLATLKADGIAGRDLQTSGFNIQPRYVRPNRNNDVKDERIIGYRVSNSLTVRIRDLSKVGDILDKAVTLGVNRGGGLRFANDNVKGHLKEARRLAMLDAMERAQTLTGAANVKVGRIVSINEQSFRPGPMPMARFAAAPADGAESVPVAAGENTYRVTVNVVFEIEQ